MLDVNYIKMIGETAVLHDLTKQHFVVYKSINDTNGVDFIVDTGKALLKIQVKAVQHSNKNGAYSFNLQKIRTNRTQTRIVPYKDGEIDIFAFFIADIDRICYIKAQDIKQTTISFRNSVGKQNNKNNPTRFLSDYTTFPC